MRPTVAALAVAFLAPLALLTVVLVGVVALLGPSTPTSPGTRTGSGPVPGVSELAAADIPPAYLALYQRAGTRCVGLDWALLAGIGKTETDHGRARLPGVASGENVAGAGGPMQFLLPTFLDIVSRYPVPPGGAQPPSRYNPHDAIHTAAAYLCDSGLDTVTTTPAERADAVHDAVFTYNHSEDYVRIVLTRAARYRATAPQDNPSGPANPSNTASTPQRREPSSGSRRTRRAPSNSPTSQGRSRHRRRGRWAGPPRPGRGRSARGPRGAPPPSTATSAPPPSRAPERAQGPETPLRPPTPHAQITWRNDMSTTHRALCAQTRFSWLARLVGMVTVTAALTVGASTATAASAFAGPTPDPDPHSDTRSYDHSGDHSDDDHSDDDRSDRDHPDRDSESDSELEPGPRVGNSSTGPRERAGKEWAVEVHGKWRFHTIAGTDDWHESPNGQLVVTSDDVWVEVTGGPRSWCFDGPTGQQRFPRRNNAVVRCG